MENPWLWSPLLRDSSSVLKASFIHFLSTLAGWGKPLHVHPWLYTISKAVNSNIRSMGYTWCKVDSGPCSCESLKGCRGVSLLLLESTKAQEVPLTQRKEEQDPIRSETWEMAVSL